MLSTGHSLLLLRSMDWSPLNYMDYSPLNYIFHSDPKEPNHSSMQEYHILLRLHHRFLFISFASSFSILLAWLWSCGLTSYSCCCVWHDPCYQKWQVVLPSAAWPMLPPVDLAIGGSWPVLPLVPCPTLRTRIDLLGTSPVYLA